MRSRLSLIGMLLALTASAHAQAAPAANPCQAGCSIVFDWGGGNAAPDADRIFGAPSDIESAFIAGLTQAGFRIVQGSAPMAITFRLYPQNRVLCDVMAGVSPDYSCHTVARGTVLFVANDSTMKAPQNVEIRPRCSDPKNYPTMRQFGAYAAESVVYAVVNDSKGTRPQVKCR